VPVSEAEPHYLPGINSENRLLRAARPVLDRMSERLGDLTCVFILVDPQARVLDRLVCQSALTKSLDSMSVAEGFVFAEDMVGTNGMGTAVELRRLTRVDGAEHYAETYRNFTCVGVPIVDRVGHEMVGVLDVACPTDPDNEFIELLAEQTARSIEDRLLEERSQLERALLDEFLAARRGNSGVVVVSDRLLMTDPQAARVLNGVEQPLVWERASKALGRNGPVEEEFATPDGGTVTSLMRALSLGGHEIGVLMRVQASPRAAVPHTPHRTRTVTRPDGLTGTNTAFVDAYRRCCAADAVLLVSGEPGTGKQALLRAVHEQTGAGPLQVHDLARCSPGEETAELAAIRRSVGSGPGLPTRTCCRRRHRCPPPCRPPYGPGGGSASPTPRGPRPTARSCRTSTRSGWEFPRCATARRTCRR
jgi:transcriptional regulator of acetoin/glycerol metabolism